MAEIQENPYSALLGTLRADQHARTVPAWRFGVLRSLSPPAVELGGQAVGAGVSVNARLLDGSVFPGDRVVVLQSADGQEFVILCKVVS